MAIGAVLKKRVSHGRLLGLSSTWRDGLGLAGGTGIFRLLITLITLIIHPNNPPGLAGRAGGSSTTSTCMTRFHASIALKPAISIAREVVHVRHSMQNTFMCNVWKWLYWLWAALYRIVLYFIVLHCIVLQPCVVIACQWHKSREERCLTNLVHESWQFNCSSA
jgi:hypothetical protein